MMSDTIHSMDTRGHTIRVAQLATVVAPSFTIFGYNQAGLGALATGRFFIDIFPQLDTVDFTGTTKALHATREGAVVASFQVGALFGALSCLFVGDRLGRKNTILLAAIITAIGSVLQLTSSNLIQFVIGRVILGLGVGLISVIIPIWQAECSSAAHRGRDVITAGIFMCFGYAISNWIDLGFFFVPHSTLQWRLPLAVSVVFSLVVAVSICFLPESPRWLVSVGRVQEATASLAALKGLPISHAVIQTEIAQIEYSIGSMATQKPSLLELFRKRDEDRLFYRFCLCVVLQFFQQACGGSLISIYASTIFQQNLGLGEVLSKIMASSVLTWKFLCCFLAFFAIDRLGRRTVFMIAGAGMSICMTALSISSSFGKQNYSASVASVTFLFMFNIFYPFGFLGGNFLYCTEVAPVRLRVAMNSVSTANHWLWNFVIAIVTPVAISTIGYHYYIIFAITSALIPVLIFFFYPETMNRNLEAINSVFRDAPTPWDIVSMARKLPQGEVVEDSMGKVEMTSDSLRDLDLAQM